MNIDTYKVNGVLEKSTVLKVGDVVNFSKHRELYKLDIALKRNGKFLYVYNSKKLEAVVMGYIDIDQN